VFAAGADVLVAGSAVFNGAGERRDLYEAMRQVAETGKGPEDQIASMGCSIKWKENA
jgi:hypothetical protein